MGPGMVQPCCPPGAGWLGQREFKAQTTGGRTATRTCSRHPVWRRRWQGCCAVGDSWPLPPLRGLALGHPLEPSGLGAGTPPSRSSPRRPVCSARCCVARACPARVLSSFPPSGPNPAHLSLCTPSSQGLAAAHHGPFSFGSQTLPNPLMCKDRVDRESSGSSKASLFSSPFPSAQRSSQLHHTAVQPFELLSRGPCREAGTVPGRAEGQRRPLP